MVGREGLLYFESGWLNIEINFISNKPILFILFIYLFCENEYFGNLPVCIC